MKGFEYLKALAKIANVGSYKNLDCGV